jgi:membrane protein YqaA with SNARE-associated domain
MAEPQKSQAKSPVHTTLVRANARAWGLATGLLLGGGLFVATNVLVLRGGANVGAHLGRLSQVFPGYEVSFRGSLLGAIYAFVIGYALGRVLAPRKPMQLDPRRRLHRHVRLNSNAWGLGLGALLAVALFATTNALVLRGGEDVGALLHYLAIYVPGYEVTFLGSMIGALAFFVGGWVAGKCVGAIYNVAVARAEG